MGYGYCSSCSFHLQIVVTAQIITLADCSDQHLMSYEHFKPLMNWKVDSYCLHDNIFQLTQVRQVHPEVE